MAGRILRVGLTGGIASGKSHVLRRLQAAGFATVDLDGVSHGLLARGGAAYAPVRDAFGERILGPSGEIDRKALGAIVFASPEARARLDALVHPLVRAQEAAIAQAAQAAGARALVTDAALLVESGLHLRFDRLVVAWCPPELQRARLQARDAIGEAAAGARMAAQMPAGEKRAFAHFVVDTSGSIADTDAQVDALASALHALDAPLPREVPRARARTALEHGPRAGPRGLSPQLLSSELEAAGGFDMARLARVLDPPAQGPWYRAATGGPPEPGPDALGPAIAIGCAARGADEPFVLAAAYSLARLTHADAADHAGGCLAALAAWAVLREERVAALDETALEAWSEQARRWAGAAPPGRVREALRRAAAGTGPSGTLPGALLALAGPPPPQA